MKRLKLALFISCGGTTACTIINACRSGILNINPVLVIASKSGITGIERVKNAGLDSDSIKVVNPVYFTDHKIFGEKLLKYCSTFNVDIVGQYGWLPLTPLNLIKQYMGKIINQHPGPLDPGREDFGGKGMYGRRVHAAVLYFRRVTNHDFWTEATTHFVTEEFDKGEVIKRQKINILSDDTVESLQKRVLSVEHEVQIEALRDFAMGKVKTQKRKLPLIQINELKILEEAKRVAKIYYPNG